MSRLSREARLSNTKFSEHCCSVVFHLSMTMAPITELLDIEVFTRKNKLGMTIYNRGIANYLYERGLVRPNVVIVDDVFADTSRLRWVITDAGRLVCQLLRLAGFKDTAAGGKHVHGRERSGGSKRRKTENVIVAPPAAKKKRGRPRKS